MGTGTTGMIVMVIVIVVSVLLANWISKQMEAKA